MRMTRTRWLFLTILIGLLTLGGIWAESWVGKVSDRVVASINQQTGLRLAHKKFNFDLQERRLYAKDIQIERPGLVLGARRITMVLNYLSRWSPWLGDDFQSLSDIGLEGANITIDPQRLQLSVPDWFQAISIDRGTLAISGIGQSVLFEQLRVLNDGSGELQIHFESAESWQFDGTYDTGQNQLSGELVLHKMPLSNLMAIVFGADQKKLDSDQLSGELSGKFLLSWRPDDGLTLSGSAQGAKGQLLLPGATAHWQHWQLRDGHFSSHQPDSARLSVSGVDLKLMTPAKKINAYTLLQQLLPSGKTSLIISDSRLELGGWTFTQLAGSVGRKTADDNWQYKLAGRLRDVGQVQLSGQLGANSDFMLKLNNARLAGPIADYGHFAGYHLQGARFNLGYDSKTREGQIDFLAWRGSASASESASVSDSASTLKALLTDSKGNAHVDFVLKSSETATPLPLQMYRAIGQQLMSIARAPLDYLNTTTASELQPTLRHLAGKAALTTSAEQNLQHLKRVMEQRPALTVAIQVGVSQSRDRPELTRQGLEVALQELYQAMGGTEETVPADVRGQLLEQMYLATQQKKIPEVGELTPEQRVKQAEQWLLANWPESTDQLEMLQQARYELLKRTLAGAGLDVERIELTKSTDDQTRREPDSTLLLQ